MPPTRRGAEVVAFSGFSLLVVAHGLDIHSTQAVLDRGGIETNPFVAAMIQGWGFNAWVLAKGALLALGLSLQTLAFKVGPTAAMMAGAVAALGSLPAFAISAHNYSLI